jgi:hypothetical protein
MQFNPKLLKDLNIRSLLHDMDNKGQTLQTFLLIQVVSYIGAYHCDEFTDPFLFFDPLLVYLILFILFLNVLFIVFFFITALSELLPDIIKHFFLVLASLA